MILIKNFILLCFIFLISGCVTQQSNNNKERKFYSSSGFALIYNDNIFKSGEVDRKMSNNNEMAVMHTLLKTNTPVKIINPETSKFIETKILKELRKIFLKSVCCLIPELMSKI